MRIDSDASMSLDDGITYAEWIRPWVSAKSKRNCVNPSVRRLAGDPPKSGGEEKNAFSSDQRKV